MQHCRQNILAATLLAVAVFAPGLASAHNFFIGLTRIELNERSGALEVIHRLTWHDVELALSHQAGRPISFDLGPEVNAMFQTYVEEHFTLTIAEQSLTLNWVGMEFDGDTVVTYQESAPLSEFVDVAISNTLLTSAFAKQLNIVSYFDTGTHRILEFTADAPRQTLAR